MLNELYLLSRALAGMALEPQCSNIQIPSTATGPVIRVCLDEKGMVVRCEQIARENEPGLWTHVDWNQNSFPVIRLTESLMELSLSSSQLQDEAKTKKIKQPAGERRRALLAKVSHAHPHPLTKKRTKTGKETCPTLDLLLRLRRQKADMLAKALQGQNAAITCVCEAYKLAIPEDTQPDNVAFLKGLRERAVLWLEVCNESELDALEVLLFNDTGNKRAQLALDTCDPSTSIYTIAARKTVKSALSSKDEARPDTAPDGEKVSSLFSSGTASSKLHHDAFPKPTLPILGQVCIFSMNEEAECNVRYGLKGRGIVPVEKDAVSFIHESLMFIVDKRREGDTWRGITGEKPESRDLLITYVDGEPDIPVKIADIFGTSEDSTERQFEADASAVCEALEGIQRKKPDSRLNLFILRKASEGQAFVALAETPSVEEVLAGAKWWNAAAKNVPLSGVSDGYIVSLPIFDKGKKRPVTTKPSAPYPGQVTALLAQAWVAKRGGSEEGKTHSNKLRSIAFGEVLDMMLQKPGKADAAAKHILSLCLDHAGSLLLGIGECQSGRTDKDWRAYGDKERLIALRAVSIVGMTLYALGSKKEDYMHEAAFQIGQVLALADRLHRCYCTVVRDGSIPPNLIGNAHFSTALDNPERALAVLAERFRIYQGWAETVGLEPGDGDKAIAIRWAKKILGQYKGLALRLHQQGLPTQCDDVMKAHILLGYLAGEETGGADK